MSEKLTHSYRAFEFVVYYFFTFVCKNLQVLALHLSYLYDKNLVQRGHQKFKIEYELIYINRYNLCIIV